MLAATTPNLTTDRPAVILTHVCALAVMAGEADADTLTRAQLARLQYHLIGRDARIAEVRDEDGGYTRYYFHECCGLWSSRWHGAGSVPA